MKQVNPFFVNFFLLMVALFAALFLLSDWLNWGTLNLASDPTITVVGESQNQVSNQIAVFNAGVDAVNDDKETATNEVSREINSIVSIAKEFGIDDKDIKTQNMSVYQTEEYYYEDGVQKSRKGQWRISNNVDFKLREIERASEFANLLTSSGATNVYGPNFSYDEFAESEVDADLYAAALENARAKAEVIAQASGKSVGEVVSVSETGGGGQFSTLRMSGVGYGSGGGGELEPGSTQVLQSLIVVFELR
jgi:hypothetical protein